LELTQSRRDDTTTRRKNTASHFDGFCPLAAPRFAGRMAGAVTSMLRIPPVTPVIAGRVVSSRRRVAPPEAP